MSWTVVPQNVTKMPRLSYIVPMTAGAAETQLYNMQNRNNYWNANNFMTNEKIIGDKADDALYKATAAQYMANDLTNQIENLLKSESFIYIIIAVVLISLILVYRMVM
jgi:chemotaxis regulatin CheY-phosphate phosphatase CheZ